MPAKRLAIGCWPSARMLTQKWPWRWIASQVRPRISPAEAAEARELKPHVVFVDADNKVMATGYDPAETFGDASLTRGDAVAR